MHSFVNEDPCDSLDKINIAFALIFDVKVFPRSTALGEDISKASFLFSSINDILYRSRTSCQNKRDFEKKNFQLQNPKNRT